MTSANPTNERVKRRYLRYLEEARGLAAATIDHAGAAIFHFEQFTGGEDFKKWSPQQAVAYKKHLMANGGKRAAELSSRATVLTKLRQLQGFFHWLADQPGYRTRIRHGDVEFFNPTNRDIRLARPPQVKVAPTLEQARAVILAAAASTDVELRDRALLACALLTGARVSALITLKLKHVRADRLGIDQDAREVRTKFSKTQTTFFPIMVGDDIRQIFLDYVDYLRGTLMWGADDPLFPASRQTVGSDNKFSVTGLARSHWKTPDPVRDAFKRLFSAAGIPYFSPHTFRNCLTSLAEQSCRTPEELKAFSQNLGHDQVLTTLTSYGAVSTRRQSEIMQRVGAHTGKKFDEFQSLLNDPEVSAILRGIKND